MSVPCDEVARLGKGIGNPNRYRIIEALMQGSRTVGDIALAVDLTQPNVSQNLKVLKEASLVTDERRGQEVFYSLNVAYMASLLRNITSDLQNGRTPQPKKTKTT